MLKLADSNDLHLILGFCGDDLIGTRIGCYCLSYGFERDFLGVWMNIIDGEVKAVIAKFYDSITVKADPDCDKDEISRFIEMLGYRDIMCDSSTGKLLGFNNCKLKKAYIYSENIGEYSCETLGEEYYKQLYSLISENIPGSFSSERDAYLSWLSDFTFRKSRSLARAKGIIDQGELISCVMTSSETPTAAIISGVATNKNKRKSGLGKSTVLSMTRELIKENKKVYVIALNESAEGFYEHIGFKFYDTVCLT